MTTLNLPYRAGLALEGPDTLSLLERIVTCRADDLAVGEARMGALLTPQGKIIADFGLTRTEGGCHLQVHEDICDALEKRLKLFRLRADVEISRSPATSAAIEPIDRIHAGLPVFGEDFGTADVFPTDVNLDLRDGIAYSKGCFVGQEVVSRMKRRGKIRKRTVSLTGASMAKAQIVRAGERKIGTVTSAAGNQALAIIRIDHLAIAHADETPIKVNDEPVVIQMPEWLIRELKAFQND